MHANDEETIAKTRNTARFFTEQRHISWVLLIGVVLWGIYGYLKMPKRKDPEVPVRVAVALTPWPGASAEKVEDLVSRKLEAKIAENAKVKKIESISRTGLSVVYVELVEGLKDTSRELDDIRLKLDDAGRTLPDGWGLGYYPGGEPSATVLKEPAPPQGSIRSHLARAWEHLESSLFVLHIRAARWGAITDANTQPFVRSWGRRDWMMGHSGSLMRRPPDDRGMFEPVGSTDTAAWQRVIDVDLHGPFLVSRVVVPHMVKAGYGRIVNIASVAGKEGNPNAAAYGAAKGGLITFTKSLGKELAQTGVLVNCVTPAAAQTAILEQVTPEFTKFMLSKIPMGRFVRVEEIAALACWLASEDCSFTTGGVFDISGGRATY